MATPEKNTETRFERYRKTWWFWLLTGLGGVALALYGFNVQIVNWRIAKICNDICPPEFAKTDSTFNILILPFERLADNTNYEVKLETTIEKRILEQAKRNNLNIKVIVDEYAELNNLPDEVTVYAKKKNATFVIYGEIEEKGIEISDINLNWKLLEDKKIDSFLGKEGSELEKQISMFEILKQGKIIGKPEYVSIWVLGIYDTFRGLYSDALTKYEVLFKDYTKIAINDPYLNQYTGDLHYFLNEIDSAEKYYNYSIALDSNRVLPYNNLACALLQKGDYEYAKSLLLFVVRLDQSNHSGYHNLAMLERDLGNFELSKSYFLKSLNINWDPLTIYAYGSYLSQVELKHDSALVMYRHFLEILPNSVYGKLRCANLLMLEEETLSDGLIYLEEAKVIEPDNPFVISLLALAHSRLKQFQKRDDYIKELVKLDYYDEDIGSDILDALKESNESQRNLEEYLLTFEKSNSVSELNNFVLGVISFNRKDFKGAHKYFSKVINLNFKNGYAHRMLGKVYYIYFNDLNKCIHNLLIAHNLMPHIYKLVLEIATAYYELKEYSFSREFYLTALRMRRGDWEVYFYLSSLEFNQFKNKDKALKYLLTALELNPSSHEIYLRISEVYDKGFNNLNKAKEYYQIARKINPTVRNSELDRKFNLN